MHSEEQDSNEIDNLLKCAEKPPQPMKTVKFTVITEKQLSQLLPIIQPQSAKILNLSNVPLTQEEIDILKLGLSFTPTSKKYIR